MKIEQETVIIRYHERLGDIARCLPLARHLHGLGHRVLVECKSQYHRLFELVSYARPICPGESWPGKVLDLQIWPSRFDDFIASGQNWMDYIYAPWPECDRQIVLDVPSGSHAGALVSDSVLVFPCGYSQRNAPDPWRVVAAAHRLFPGHPVIALGKRELGFYELPSIPSLVEHIRRARYVLTVNSAPTILASAVREAWHHIPDTDDFQDFKHPGQIVVPRP